jgi:hypothetical protein
MKLVRRAETIERNVMVRGIMPFLFNRYAGDNKTQLTVRQKMYFDKDNRSLVLPSLNIKSFLSATNTLSAPKLLYDSRKYKPIALACLSFVDIDPFLIPFKRDGEQIVVGDFTGETDEQSGAYVFEAVGRLKDGIPCPCKRPALPTPWELEFTVRLTRNDVVTEEMLQDLFVRGGIQLGFGSFRGYFGKFEVVAWY